MNRRSFLGTLLAGTVGLVLPKDLLWEPIGVPTWEVPKVRPGAIVGLEAMTREIARLMSEQMKSSVPTQQGEFLVGSTVNTGRKTVTMSDQLAVDFSYFPKQIDHDGVDSERWLAPVAASLVSRAHEHGLNVFAPLQIPKTVDKAAVFSTPVVSVRGIQAMLLDSDFTWRTMVRFDVLGGMA